MRKSGIAAAVILLAAGVSISAQTVATAPAEEETQAVLESSPRHGEWVTIDAGDSDVVDAWVVYPERSDRAPVVVVIHEIFGLTDWIRSVADRLAAEGFIAVAPDFLSGKAPDGGGSRAVSPDAARGLIGGLEEDEIVRRLDASARYAASLPAATSEYATVGFCWGGAISFMYATEQPDLGAAAQRSTLGASVVFYGTSPETDRLSGIRAPVLGLYGGDDARVNATIPDAEAELNRLGLRFEKELYEGAGHAFLRNQSGREANARAARDAWPRMVEFLKQELEG